MENSSKIQQVSSVIYFTCFALMAAWVILWGFNLVNIWYRPAALEEYLHDSMIPTLLRMGEADLIRSIPATIIMLISPVLGLYGLWRLSRMFNFWRQGIYFTSDAAMHLFVFSAIAVFNHLFESLLFAVADFVLALGVPEIPYGWPLRINGDEVTLLVYYVAFLTVSWVLLEASKIADENSEFV